MASFLRSPSMVLGTPTTAMGSPLEAKNSARRAAFVFESSPPTTTTASSLRRLAVSRALANCSGVSILVRPEPMRSKPPVLRYLSTSAESMSMHLSSTKPPGPPRKPKSSEAGLAALSPS